MPKANAKFWADKLEQNRRRDQDKDKALVALGWTAIHVWEHEDVEDVADDVAALWRSSITSGGSDGSQH